MKLFLFMVMGLVLLPVMVRAIPAETAILQKYIKMGLRDNLVLKQENFSLDQSLSALKEARGMFLPKISLEARYSLAGGGRIIEFPVGELMNPVYETLNQLLGIHNQPAPFPTDIEDEMIPFLRPREHETKIRLVQPIFQPRIYHYVKIKSRISRIQGARVDAFRSQLVGDIKTAYFTHLKTLKIRGLLANTRVLLEENLRVSKSLFKNHKVTEEIVFRSRAELSKLDRNLAEAKKNINLSTAYFNFLLNRSLDEKISGSVDADPLLSNIPDLDRLEARALDHRAEFAQVQASIEAAQHNIRLQGAQFLPAVTVVLDYGFQGEQYRFGGEDDFWMASLVLSWNLFNGFKDSEKKFQARVEKKKLHARQLELEQQVRMQVREAYHNLEVARETIRSAQDLLHSRREAFHIVAKKYEQGMVPQIEHIQARNEYTRAGINRIIAVFDCYIMEARLEHASASFPLTNKETER